jgi:hypothetical protein
MLTLLAAGSWVIALRVLRPTDTVSPRGGPPMPGSAYAPEAPKIAAAGIADGTRILIMKVPPSFRGGA